MINCPRDETISCSHQKELWLWSNMTVWMCSSFDAYYTWQCQMLCAACMVQIFFFSFSSHGEIINFWGSVVSQMEVQGFNPRSPLATCYGVLVQNIWPQTAPCGCVETGLIDPAGALIAPQSVCEQLHFHYTLSQNKSDISDKSKKYNCSLQVFPLQLESGTIWVKSHHARLNLQNAEEERRTVTDSSCS